MSDNIIGFKSNFKPKQHTALEKFLQLLKQNTTDKMFIQLRAILFPNDVKHPLFIGYVAGNMSAQIDEVHRLLEYYLDKENSPQVPVKLMEALDTFVTVTGRDESVLVMNIPFVGKNLHLTFFNIKPYGYVLTNAHWNEKSFFQIATDLFLETQNATLEDVFFFE
jgi:hypothetical protein